MPLYGLSTEDELTYIETGDFVHLRRPQLHSRESDFVIRPSLLGHLATRQRQPN